MDNRARTFQMTGVAARGLQGVVHDGLQQSDLIHLLTLYQHILDDTACIVNLCAFATLGATVLSTRTRVNQHWVTIDDAENNLPVYLRTRLSLHDGNVDSQTLVQPLHMRHFYMKGLKQACSQRVLPLNVCHLLYEALVLDACLYCLHGQVQTFASPNVER